MAKKIYEETNISAIAQAIRGKKGSQNTYTTAEMAAAIESIQTGGNLISKTINQNGTYIALNDGADGFSQVEVDIPSKTIPNFVYYTKNIGSSQEIVHEFDSAGKYTVIISLVQQGDINTLSITLNNEDISSLIEKVENSNVSSTGSFYYYVSDFDVGDVIRCANIENVSSRGMQVIIVDGNFDVSLIGSVPNGGSTIQLPLNALILVALCYGYYNGSNVLDYCYLYRSDFKGNAVSSLITVPATGNDGRYWYGGSYAMKLYPPLIREIRIKTLPNKIEYIDGDTINYSGLEVMGDYPDGTSEPITLQELSFSSLMAEAIDVDIESNTSGLVICDPYYIYPVDTTEPNVLKEGPEGVTYKIIGTTNINVYRPDGTLVNQWIIGENNSNAVFLYAYADQTSYKLYLVKDVHNITGNYDMFETLSFNEPPPSEMFSGLDTGTRQSISMNYTRPYDDVVLTTSFEIKVKKAE